MTEAGRCNSVVRSAENAKDCKALSLALAAGCLASPPLLDPCQGIQCEPLSSCPEPVKVCVVVGRAPFVPILKARFVREAIQGRGPVLLVASSSVINANSCASAKIWPSVASC